MTPDEVTLTLPGRRDFYRIAHLVLGGLAVRLELTYEQLEDLQLGLASVLSEHEADVDLSVTLRVEGDAIRTVVGLRPRRRRGARRRRLDRADEERPVGGLAVIHPRKCCAFPGGPG